MGITQYEMEDFEHAAKTLEDFCNLKTNTENLLTGQFVLALCEEALGLGTESEQRMWMIYKDHPESSVAPRAIFWLASNRLAHQEYGKARELFTDLCDRYPDGEYAAKSRSYLERLKSLNQ